MPCALHLTETKIVFETHLVTWLYACFIDIHISITNRIFGKPTEINTYSNEMNIIIPESYTLVSLIIITNMNNDKLPSPVQIWDIFGKNLKIWGKLLHWLPRHQKCWNIYDFRNIYFELDYAVYGFLWLSHIITTHYHSAHAQLLRHDCSLSTIASELIPHIKMWPNPT